MPWHSHDRHRRYARPLATALLSILLLAVLGGCNKTLAPVEDRSTARVSQHSLPDGYYSVRRGDSLHSIAFHYGLDWRDIARWNGIASPYVIYPEQELRLSPPASRPAVQTRAARPQPSISERALERPAEPPRSETRDAPAVATKTIPSSSPSPGAEKPATAQSPPARSKTAATADPSSWLWPVKGQILSTFRADDPARNGIEIAGKEGQAIAASAAGEVVYSGSGLIGYGELIIIKHSDRMLSAYAHNRKRLVAEGQAVSAGEKIAEMGRDDRNRAMLHFEIRRDGNPQDPLKYLPKR